MAVLGYPPVPRSTHSVLVVQSGEVTGYINDISNNNYLLFSAIARPGNSGGPVVSEKGSILGIVSQEISHQDTPVFPFYSAVPTSEIIKALNDLNCPVELPIDTYE